MSHSTSAYNEQNSTSTSPEQPGVLVAKKRGPRTDGAASSVAVGSLSRKKPQGFFEERSLPAIEMTPGRLRYLTRRDVLLFGAGAVAALAGGGFLLPQETLSRLAKCASKCGLPWEGVVSEQSTGYR